VLPVQTPGIIPWSYIYDTPSNETKQASVTLDKHDFALVLWKTVSYYPE